jgi:hypothetical protein
LRGCRLGESYQHVVELIVPLAAAVAEGTHTCVRSVPLDLLTSRLRGGIPGWPLWSDVAPLLQSCPPAIAQSSSPSRLGTLHITPLHMAKFDKHVKFLRATSKLKLSKNAGEEVKSIVLQVWPEAQARRELLRDRIPTRWMLMWSRLQFDATMMLTMQTVWRWVRDFDPHSFSILWADGSPSSGYECFAVFENVVSTARPWSRTLMVSFLGYGFMHLRAKVYSLLWKLWVECQDVGLMRWKLKHIAGMVTDQGTEADIADSPDYLPDFLQTINYPGAVSRQTYLLPLCVWVKGWHHGFDHIAQWVSCPTPN